MNYASFDRNHDGRVTSDELAVAVVNKYDDSCGQTRGVACVRTDGVDVCLGSVSFLGGRVNFSTAAHELTHQLGMFDLYGPGASWNSRATLAAATCGYAMDTSFQVDAWHKMAFGWVEPRVVSLNDPPTLEALDTPEAFGAVEGYAKRPVLVFDPDRGTQEFFLLEARNSDGLYDDDVADSGMAVWLVNLNADLLPADVFFQADADPELDHIFGVRLFHGPGASGETGPRAGLGRFFRTTDAAISLRYGDGTSAGVSLTFRWSDATRRRGHAQIGGDATFRARIDRREINTTPGAVLSLPGVFGVIGPRQAYLTRGGVEVALSGTLNPEGPAQLTIPAGTALGDYTLHVRGTDARSVGNLVDVHVR